MFAAEAYYPQFIHILNSAFGGKMLGESHSPLYLFCLFPICKMDVIIFFLT